mmetsp:Transcript_14092/g.40268  ORF Transcript_14092/g.40268 Transcript_14092/m.40268 type:complete len:303 (-) Transcript_14092:69-977(-)
MPGGYAARGLLPLLRLPPCSVLLLLSLRALPGGLAAHPCEAEVSSACPERPPSELATCLKTPSEHETETTLSSECMDFIALNKACAEDIKKFCDEAFFSEDTILCLKTWTDPENLSEKCAKTMKWAAPSSDESEEESEEGPTDELGMSDKDREEKKEWQAKRRAERGDAIERMKMKEADAKKEKERVELENFKKDNPEAYAEMQRQKEEDKRQAQEMKRRERLLAAAMEREKRKKAGLDEEEPAPSAQGKRSSGTKGTKKSGFSNIWGILFVLLLLGGGYYLFTSLGGAKPSKGGGKKKKRG